MNRREKKRFVRDLMGSVQKQVLRQITDGKIPDEWDGHELRKLLADNFHHEVSSTMRTDRKRIKAYLHTVIVNNL